MLNLQVHLLTFYMLFFYFSENYKQYIFSCDLTMLMSECHIEKNMYMYMKSGRI